MGFYDFINGTKKKEEGMIAGAKPFYAKIAQRNKEDKIILSKLKEIMLIDNKLLNTVEAIEKKRLYGLYIQADIRSMEIQDKKLIINILYTLSTESSNDLQKTYIHSIQKYLEIVNAQALNDFSEIDSGNDVITQKAILQSCIEYLSLGKKLSSFYNITKKGDSLFDLFNINLNGKKAVLESVLKTFQAIGPKGVAERYEFVSQNEQVNDQENEQEFELEYEQDTVQENNQEDSYLSNKYSVFKASPSISVVATTASLTAIGGFIISLLTNAGKKTKPKAGKDSFSSTGGLSF